MNEYLTTETTLSIGTSIKNKEIETAKKFMEMHYNNKYNLNPHFNFLIIAMPDSALYGTEIKLTEYFKNKKPLTLNLGDLHYDPKQKFFSIPVVGTEVIKLHTELLTLLQPLRKNYIRRKDEEKIAAGIRDNKDTEYITRYGYARVLDNFMPHITIGNIDIENFDIAEIERNLRVMLSTTIGGHIVVDGLEASFYLDAEVQSLLQFKWKKRFELR